LGTREPNNRNADVRMKAATVNTDRRDVYRRVTYIMSMQGPNKMRKRCKLSFESRSGRAAVSWWCHCHYSRCADRLTSDYSTRVGNRRRRSVSLPLKWFRILGASQPWPLPARLGCCKRRQILDSEKSLQPKCGCNLGSYKLPSSRLHSSASW
jgi:hypothetical protein